MVDPDEVFEINVVRLAMLLHKTPAEIRAMPDRDVANLMEVKKIDDEIEMQRIRMAGR